MSDWPCVPLATLCDPQRSITYGIVKVGDYVPSGVPIIRGGDIRDNRIVFNDEKRVSESVSLQFRRTILTGGEILINLIAEPGHSAIAPDSMAGFNVSRDVAVIPLDQSVNHAYVNYYLRSPKAIGWLRARLQGSVTLKINLSTLSEVPIPLPDRSTQEAIASVLGALDDKIAVNDQIAKSCHQLAQAISARAHTDSSVKALSEVAIITMGSSPPGESYNEDGVGMPFYQGTRDFGLRFPSRRVWCTSPVRIAKRGCTLASVRAPVGELNVAREPCCIGRGVAALESRYGTPSVLFHELVGLPDVWKPYESEGTVFGAITRAQMESLAIKSLEHSAAQRLEAAIRPLDKIVEAVFIANQTLSKLRDVLLPRLMSGDIRVWETEETVEDMT